MKGALDSLGVKPKERRAVILMLMAFFIIGNIIWLVFEVPDLNKARRDRDRYEKKNKDNTGLDADLLRVNTMVETLRGGELKLIANGREAQKLMQTVNRQALASGLNITRDRGGPASRAKKDQQFEEFKRIVSFYGGLLELTNFLKSMADEKSMIRVSNMAIKPTTDRLQLQVDLTFIASYPKSEEDSKPGSSKKGKKK